MKTYLWLLAFISATFFAQAQDCACCGEPYQAFDFWIGEWTVQDTNGVLLGTNHIYPQEGSCYLKEEWQSASGGTGSSVNYFDSSDSLWHQLWISANGFILKLQGKREGAAMVLRSDLQINKKGQSYYHQISWTPQDENVHSLIQRWDLLDPEGVVLRTMFYGVYHRQEP